MGTFQIRFRRSISIPKLRQKISLRAESTFSLFNLLFHPPFRFIKEYLFKSGFRDGLPGFIIIVSTMYYVFIKYAKLWELTRSIAPSPSSEGGAEKCRSGSTLGLRPDPKPRDKSQPLGEGAGGLTISKKEKENDS